MGPRTYKEKEQPDKPASIQTVQQILKCNTREEWMNRWNAGSTGCAMYADMTAPKAKDSINLLPRAN